MLQSMRDKMQGLVAGTIAVIIALTFMLWGVQNYLHTGNGNKEVASVNGKKITQEELRITYERTKRQEMMKLGAAFSFDQKAQSALKKDVLQQIIKKQILSQVIEKMKLGIGKEHLWAVVSGLPIFQLGGKFSLERFQQIIENMFFSEREFLAELEGSLLKIQLEKGIIGSAFVLPNEVAAVRVLSAQARDFGYFIVPPNRFANAVKIAESEVEKYYVAHQSDFTLPEKISVQYVKLSSRDLQKDIKVTNDELKSFYQNNIDSFSTPKRWQIIRVSLLVSANADAKSVENAKKRLDGFIAQEKNGEDLARAAGFLATTSWITRNELGADFAAHLDKLNVGQTSTPFRTSDAYNLIKVLAIQQAKTQEYSAVASKVKQNYLHQKLVQNFAENSDKLADLAYTNSDSLDPIAKVLGLKINTTELITASGGASGILANKKVVKTAFSESVLKQGYNSSPIELSSGEVIVLRIKDHIPEKVRALNEVHSMILQKLKDQAMQKEAEEFSQKILGELQNGKQATAISKQYSLAWKTVSHVLYDQKGIDTNLRESAFNLEKPATNAVSAASVRLDNGAYAVVMLSQVYMDSGRKEFNTAAKSSDFADRFGQYDYDLLVDAAMKDAKIKTFAEPEDEKS